MTPSCGMLMGKKKLKSRINVCLQTMKKTQDELIDVTALEINIHTKRPDIKSAKCVSCWFTEIMLTASATLSSPSD